MPHFILPHHSIKMPHCVTFSDLGCSFYYDVQVEGNHDALLGVGLMCHRYYDLLRSGFLWHCQHCILEWDEVKCLIYPLFQSFLTYKKHVTHDLTHNWDMAANNGHFFSSENYPKRGQFRYINQVWLVWNTSFKRGKMLTTFSQLKMS